MSFPLVPGELAGVRVVWAEPPPRPPSPHLRPVRQEDGTGQIARDAAEDENDGDAMPARQLLQVPQHRHLESHRHQAVDDAGERDPALETPALPEPLPSPWGTRRLTRHPPPMARVTVAWRCPPLFSPKPSGITDLPNGYPAPVSPPTPWEHWGPWLTRHAGTGTATGGRTGRGPPG